MYEGAKTEHNGDELVVDNVSDNHCDLASQREWDSSFMLVFREIML